MKFLIFLALIGVISTDNFTLVTNEEGELVRGAWNAIKNNEVDILYNIFKAYPDIQAKFPKFAGKDLDTIKGTADFALHATRIVSFITSAINLAGSPATKPAIKTLLNELGQNHKNRGVTKEQFNEFRTALTTYVSANAPWGDNVAAAWNQAIDNTYFVIFSSLDGNPVV